jgi:hypothetical protein
MAMAKKEDVGIGKRPRQVQVGLGIRQCGRSASGERKGYEEEEADGKKKAG